MWGEGAVVSVPGLTKPHEAGLPKNAKKPLDFTAFSFKEKTEAQ